MTYLDIITTEEHSVLNTFTLHSAELSSITYTNHL
jgi:hypothetical protein